MTVAKGELLTGVNAPVLGSMAKTYRWLSPVVPLMPTANLPVKSVRTPATPKANGLPTAWRKRAGILIDGKRINRQGRQTRPTYKKFPVPSTAST